jgi:hypothetical protein
MIPVNIYFIFDCQLPISQRAILTKGYIEKSSCFGFRRVAVIEFSPAFQGRDHAALPDVVASATAETAHSIVADAT